MSRSGITTEDPSARSGGPGMRNAQADGWACAGGGACRLPAHPHRPLSCNDVCSWLETSPVEPVYQRRLAAMFVAKPSLPGLDAPAWRRVTARRCGASPRSSLISSASHVHAPQGSRPRHRGRGKVEEPPRCSRPRRRSGPCRPARTRPAPSENRSTRAAPPAPALELVAVEFLGLHTDEPQEVERTKVAGHDFGMDRQDRGERALPPSSQYSPLFLRGGAENHMSSAGPARNRVNRAVALRGVEIKQPGR